jgi:hypothetical protein
VSAYEKIIASLVILTRDGYCLLTKFGHSAPGEELTREKPSTLVADDLFYKFTGMKNGEWAIIRQVGFLDGDRDFWPTVVYSVELPERVDLKSDYVDWVLINSIVTSHPSEDVRRTLRKIKLAVALGSN